MKLVAPATSVARSEPPPAQALQEVFAFGELGVPAGEPGSFALAASEAAALEAAVTRSRTSELNVPPAAAGLR